VAKTVQYICRKERDVKQEIKRQIIIRLERGDMYLPMYCTYCICAIMWLCCPVKCKWRYKERESNACSHCPFYTEVVHLLLITCKTFQRDYITRFLSPFSYNKPPRPLIFTHNRQRILPDFFRFVALWILQIYSECHEHTRK
jgi:hypothetical protein